MYGGVKKTKCDNCEQLISNNNHKKHVLSCLKSEGTKTSPKIRGVDFDPNWGFKDGSRCAWNKGLSKDADERVAKQANTLKSKIESGDVKRSGIALWTTEQHSLHAKNVGFGGYRENAGRSKKFKVTDSFGSNVVLQSTYELECAVILDGLGIRWLRPKALMYDDRRYFADFYLCDHDIYLDPKNDYKAKMDEEKIRMVREENSVTIIVLSRDKISETSIKKLLSLEEDQ